MPEILLVGVGLMGRPYVDAARRLGLSVTAVENPVRAAALGLHDTVDRLIPVEGDHDEDWARAAASAAAAHRPDGVIAFTEPQVMAAALVADRYGLAGPSLRAAVISRNKALQRGLFGLAGVRQPEFRVTSSLTDAADWAHSRFPVVVKPLSSAGSVGVELVADAGAYDSAAVRRAGESPLIVETAVEGAEYSCEAIVREGEVWFSSLTAKETTEAPYFVETGHRMPVELGRAAGRQVDALVAAVLDALGMASGIIHLEFRLAQSGPTLMEVAVRMPGDYLMELLGITYGIDWFEMVVRLALAMPLPDPPVAPVRHTAAYFPLAEAGVITAIEGLTEVRALSSVDRAGTLAEVGEVVPAVVSSEQRRAYVLLSSPDPVQLDHDLAFARRHFVLRTRPSAGPVHE